MIQYQMISSRKKERWITQLTECIEKRMSDPNFTIHELSIHMNTSQRQLYRKVKDYTGETPNEFINQIRFQKAYQYFMAGEFETIAEVAFAVGFKDPGYFSRKFKERYGSSLIEH